MIASISNCSVALELSETVNLHGELCIKARERVAIVGPNGSGKSTLLLLLAGLVKASKGKVQVFGVQPNIRSESFRSRIGLLLQHPDDQLLAPTVFMDVSLGLRALGWDEAKIKQRTSYVLKSLDIYHLKDRAPHHLSGGEKKMVALAGALVHEPELLLLDEPFAGLDGFAVVSMIHALAEFSTKGSIVISSHDIDGITTWADMVYFVANGTISHPYRAEQVFAERERMSAELGEYPKIPAVYSRLLVERFGAKCYNAKEVVE